MRFIGDVHGKMSEYIALTHECDASIQVGDFGAGFVDLPALPLTHRFIRGNHDSPEVCSSHPNWICDGTYQTPMFFLGGAYSIDRHLRREGVSWWRNEELSQEELWTLVSGYENLKPSVVVSHDCPQTLVGELFGRQTYQIKSRTAQALATMWEIHQPDFWIFGHWHISVCKNILGCRFICLAELEYIDLDI